MKHEFSVWCKEARLSWKNAIFYPKGHFFFLVSEFLLPCHVGEAFLDNSRLNYLSASAPKYFMLEVKCLLHLIAKPIL